MIVSCKPQLEALENRLTMNASALSAGLEHGAGQPRPLPVLLVLADRQDFFLKPQTVSGRITGVVADPMDSAAGTPLPSVTDLIVEPFNPVAATRFDSENKYVVVRRAVDLGADTFDSRPGVGVLKSLDGRRTW